MSLVTVIISSYNHSAYIKEAIASVAAQSYKPIQIIVIDDKSTDDSAKVISELQQSYDFTYLQNDINIGLNNSIIKALDHAQGIYISLLASDDFLHPDKIADQVKYIEENKMDGVYSNGYEYLGTVGKIINLDSFQKAYNNGKALDFICRQDFGAPLLQSGLFTEKVFRDSVAIRKEFKSDDWAFAIKMFRDYRTGFMNKPLFYYRLHGTNTHKNYWATFPMRIDIISRLIPDQYKNVAMANIFLSQGTYLLYDNKIRSAIKCFRSSLVFNFSFKSLVLIMKSVAYKIIKSPAHD